VEPFTVGIEEEAMLLDPATLDLAPRVGDVLARLDGDARFTRELPAAQIELATAPTRSASDALAQLAAARAELLRACEGIARPAAAGVHPFAATRGELNEGERYELIREAYGPVARLQLVAALQVHVAVGGAERTLAVHDALRSYLPELTALAANGAFHDGRDSGLASVRPLICGLLRARACRRRWRAGSAWRRSCAGARAPAHSPRRGCGGGSCARAERLGAGSLLSSAHALVERNGALRQRDRRRARRARAGRVAGRPLRRRAGGGVRTRRRHPGGRRRAWKRLGRGTPRPVSAGSLSTPPAPPASVPRTNLPRARGCDRLLRRARRGGRGPRAGRRVGPRRRPRARRAGARR
jgi:hypothetical protein